jgi:hypothetical protein
LKIYLGKNTLYSWKKMSSENESQEPKRDIKMTVDKIRRDLSHASKDIASASKTWVGSTAKFVPDLQTHHEDHRHPDETTTGQALASLQVFPLETG